MNNRNNYIVKNVYKSFIVVSILSALIATVGMMIDNIVVGQFLGTNCLSAMGIVSPISLIFSAVGNISSSGGATLAARELGHGDKEKVCSIFTVTIFYTLIMGALLTVVCFIFAPQIAVVLGANGEIIEPTVGYLRGFALGAVPTIMMPTIMAFAKMDGSAKLPLASIGVMSLLDVVLDLLVAAVLHGGMFGMAMATTISYFAAVAVGFLHFTKDYNTLKLVRPINGVRELGEMVMTGAPTAINRICETLKIVIFNNMLIIISGAGAVAALNVRSQVSNLVGSLIMGAGQALLPIVALFYGEQDREALKLSVKESIKLGMVLCIVAMVLLLAFPQIFINMLGVGDEDIVVMAKFAIRTFAILMPVKLINVLWTSFYQSTKHSTHALIISISQAFVFTVLSALVLVGPMQVNGIFLAFFVGEVFTLIYIVVYVMIAKRNPKPTIDEFLLLPDSFEEDVIKKWDLSIENDMSQVMKLSERITERAKEENMDGRLAQTLAVAVEEIAGNIVEHSFKLGEKKWFDLMIVEKSDEFIIHLKDNGKMFNPVKYLKEQEAKGDYEHMGIKLVTLLAKDVRYSRSIGLNNLIIEVGKEV